ncbi:hypothetical protein C3943_21500 [Lysinibacillus sp. B2A1]|nr:hypothetical protein C3943_21500 [Lysinibacillus sp. B2A1]
MKNVKGLELKKKDEILVSIISMALFGLDLHFYKGAGSEGEHYTLATAEEVSKAYQFFNDCEDECIKVILKP